MRRSSTRPCPGGKGRAQQVWRPRWVQKEGREGREAVYFPFGLWLSPGVCVFRFGNECGSSCCLSAGHSCRPQPFLHFPCSLKTPISHLGWDHRGLPAQAGCAQGSISGPHQDFHLPGPHLCPGEPGRPWAVPMAGPSNQGAHLGRVSEGTGHSVRKTTMFPCAVTAAGRWFCSEFGCTVWIRSSSKPPCSEG